MGTIIQNFVNGLTTNGVLGASNINNASLNNITSISGPEMTLVSSATASASTSIEFTLGNFKEYKFFFVNIHNSVTDANILVNFSTDGGANYNVTKTTTYFRATHAEADGGTALEYRTGSDLAQSTSAQVIMAGIRSDNDGCGVGILQLFNPSSTTFVKHFMAQTNIMQDNILSENVFVAGYGNTTSAINAVQFSVSTGNIDEGSIYMYGIGA
jgi:hypothetical protein